MKPVSFGLLALLTAPVVSHAQDPPESAAHAVTTLADGGIAIVGRFERGLDLDADGVVEITSSSPYQEEAFVARLDADGRTLWARPLAGLFVSATDVASDPRGGVVVVGDFQDSLRLHDGRSARGDGHETFVVRYDPSGAVAWLATAGGIATDGTHAVAIAPNGDVVVVGRVAGASTEAADANADADFDGDGTPDLEVAGGGDAFVARYSPEGRLLWVRGAGAEGAEAAERVTVDTQGRAYVVGTFEGAVDFDGDGTVDATAAGESDVFVAAYDPDGALAWVRATGAPGLDLARGVGATDGRVHAARVLQETDGQGPRAFVETWSADGEHTARVELAAGVEVRGLAAGQDAVFLAASFARCVSPIVGGPAVTSEAGSTDALFAALTPAGEVRWLAPVGGPGFDDGTDITLGPAGEVFGVGSLATGVGSLLPTTFFVARLEPTGPLRWVRAAIDPPPLGPAPPAGPRPESWRIEVTDLGTLGGANSMAVAISSGLVVGMSETAEGTREAFVWSAERGMSSIAITGAVLSTAHDVNSRGEVVGSWSDGSHTHGFLWSRDGGVVDLGLVVEETPIQIDEAGRVIATRQVESGGETRALAIVRTPEGEVVELPGLGGPNSLARAQGPNGAVVGWSQTASQEVRPVLWPAAGGVVDLGTLGGGAGAAYAINASGAVAGQSMSDRDERRAFAWTRESGMVDLGSDPEETSWALGIDDSGRVLGLRFAHDDGRWLFLATPGSERRDLEILPGQSEWDELGARIAPGGWIAGTAEPFEGDPIAFAWTPDSGIIDLGGLGWPTGTVLALDGQGRVVGASPDACADQHAVMWTVHPPE